MPEYIRSLIVILIMATAVFYFLRVPAAEIIGTRTFNLRRNLWFGVTLIAFLAHNYWLFIFLTWLLLIFAAQRDKNKISLFLFLLFVVPQGGVEIPGFGLVNYLFLLNHQRFLTLVILLPLFLNLLGRGKKPGMQNNAMDTLVVLYIVLCVLLQFRGTTFTSALRESFYLLIDIGLPYYVVSRSLTCFDDFKDSFFSYVSVILILSALGIFEFLKSWHLYSAVEASLGLQNLSSYLFRSGFLRAHVSLERIPLGYVIAIGLGFLLLFLDLYPRRRKYLVMVGGIIAGLISPLSRGPWVGAAALTIVYLFFSPNRFRKLSLLTAALTILVVVISLTPLGSSLMGLIPFIGETETENITYRQQLLSNSWIVIMQNPLFGSVDFLSTPEMEAMRTGEGIIDVVNTYLGVMLNYGLLGLTLFAGIFIIACLKVFTRFTRSKQIDAAEKSLGKVLLATLLCIMVTIFTVSSVSAIPIMYWIVLGMCSAYIRFIGKKQTGPAINRLK